MEKGFSKALSVLISLALTGIAFLNTSFPAQAAAAARQAKHQQINSTPLHAPGEVIVKLRDGISVNALRSNILSTLAVKLGAGKVLSIKPFMTDSSLNKIKLADDKDVQAAIDTLKTNSAVEYAEPNFIYHALQSGVPNDPDFAKLWGILNTGQTDAAGQTGLPGSDINVLPLWQMGMTGSKEVVVAVIDTGVDWNHPDLKDNIFTNTKEIPGNGVDDDGNGFIDDIHGWNFADHTANSMDDHGHGSHCSGTIGGAGNNGIGVAGVNWHVTIMPVKFLSADGSGTLEGAVEAINYARMMKVRVMSNSWGGGSFSQTLFDAIKATRDAGILFVAAAGNDGNDNDASASYPATYDVDNVVSVAATDNKDQLAYFSNYGKTKVHVAAPGVKVYSTFKAGTYDTLSGTSMATPHVSGIAALMISVHPEWDYKEIKDRLIKTSQPVRGLRSKVLAKGRVSAYNAMMGIIPPTNEPDPAAWVDVPMTIESEHPYQASFKQTYPINYPGAKFIRVFFEKVDLEKKYDTITVSAANGEAVEKITGTYANYTSEYVQGDSLNLLFQSDSSVQNWGFKVSKIQVIK